MSQGVQVRPLSPAPKIDKFRLVDFSSIAKQWYIITARSAVHIISPFGAVYNFAFGSLNDGLRPYCITRQRVSQLRNDDIQHFVLVIYKAYALMIYTPYGVIRT